MTKNTANRLYTYPECDPPLVRDRSDIDFMRQLAADVNNDANLREFDIQEFIEKPDAARIAFAGSLPVTGSGKSFIIPYDSITFDNTTGSTTLGASALSPAERGWYMVASTVRCTNGGEQTMMVRHLVNGSGTGRRFEGPSFPINGNEENMAVVDILSCNVGDLITTQVKASGAGGTYTYEARLAMFQVMKLDV